MKRSSALVLGLLIAVTVVARWVSHHRSVAREDEATSEQVANPRGQADSLGSSGQISLADTRKDTQRERSSTGTFAQLRSERSSLSAMEAAPTDFEPDLGSLTFLVDGLEASNPRIGYQASPDGVVVDLEHTTLALVEVGTIAICTTDREVPRWSGPIDVSSLREGDSTYVALPLSQLRGSVIEAGTGQPIVASEIQGQWQSESPWRTWLGVDGTIEATTDQLGRFELEVACTGTLDLVCTSPLHQSGRLSVDVARAQHDLDAIELLARPTLRVRLLGAEGEPEEHYAAHTVTGTRAPFGDDWFANVPLDLDFEFMDLAIGIPGDLEVTTFVPGHPADAPSEGVTIDLSGGAVEVTLVGDSPVDERLLAVVFYTDVNGREVFTNVWAPPGSTKRIPVGIATEVSVDAAFLATDRTPRTLARRTTVVPPGEVVAVTIELPDTARRLGLSDATGARIEGGNVWFSWAGCAHLSTPGGALDADGTTLLPDLQRAPLWLAGEAGPDAIPYAGVVLHVGSPAPELTIASLGNVTTSDLELISPNGAPLASATRMSVVCAHSGYLATAFEVPRGSQYSLRWFSESNANLILEPLDIWSPRDPIPLRPGSLRIPVVHRAWLALRIGERDLVEAVHQETGLTLAELRADPSVKIERYEAGVRLWGIPTGHYTVTLSGEQEPRGPFLAAPAQWTVIESQYLE